MALGVRDRFKPYLDHIVLGIAISGFSGSDNTYQLALCALLTHAHPDISAVYVSGPTNAAVNKTADSIHDLGEGTAQHLSAGSVFHSPLVVREFSLRTEVE
ncbi:hypothetical protein SEUCBS139899_004467 [Sporothrix eucalyptigena]|uniref:CheB-type methylesterase domain-containing protein n=1 Tax=Sporothrix eucalyptigena TaxID=1812306 RepID=A0ABP0BGE8_9PEZI